MTKCCMVQPVLLGDDITSTSMGNAEVSPRTVRARPGQAGAPRRPSSCIQEEAWRFLRISGQHRHFVG